MSRRSNREHREERANRRAWRAGETVGDTGGEMVDISAYVSDLRIGGPWPVSPAYGSPAYGEAVVLAGLRQGTISGTISWPGPRGLRGIKARRK